MAELLQVSASIVQKLWERIDPISQGQIWQSLTEDERVIFPRLLSPLTCYPEEVQAEMNAIISRQLDELRQYREEAGITFEPPSPSAEVLAAFGRQMEESREIINAAFNKLTENQELNAPDEEDEEVEELDPEIEERIRDYADGDAEEEERLRAATRTDRVLRNFFKHGPISLTRTSPSLNEPNDDE